MPRSSILLELGNHLGCRSFRDMWLIFRLRELQFRCIRQNSSYSSNPHFLIRRSREKGYSLLISSKVRVCCREHQVQLRLLGRNSEYDVFIAETSQLGFGMGKMGFAKIASF